MTPGLILAELLMHEVRRFCSLLLTSNLCHSVCPTDADLHEGALAHQGLETCAGGPQNRYKPHSWAFQLHQTVSYPKDLFGNPGRVSCSQLPCHELQEGECPPSFALLP